MVSNVKPLVVPVDDVGPTRTFVVPLKKYNCPVPELIQKSPATWPEGAADEYVAPPKGANTLDVV